MRILISVIALCLCGQGPAVAGDDWYFIAEDWEKCEAVGKGGVAAFLETIQDLGMPPYVITEEKFANGKPIVVHVLANNVATYFYRGEKRCLSALGAAKRQGDLAMTNREATQKKYK